MIKSFMPGAAFIGVGDEYDVPQIEQVVYVVSGGLGREDGPSSEGN